MKTAVLALIFILTSSSLNAATIISYGSKKKGDQKLTLINSSQILITEYHEKDKILSLYVNSGDYRWYYEYKVSTVEKALEILKKVHDPNDASLIELENK